MNYYSRNGEILPSEEAVISLFSIEFTYGFGVYETIRVTKNRVQYRDQHVDRLLNSASIIGLDHQFSTQDIRRFIDALAERIEEPSFNIKMLLIGGKQSDDANLYILPMNPRYPDRKLYKQGADAITVNYERYLPNAKTLNMLPSYLAYRKAKHAGAYDAVLVNANGEMLEGTMTNLFGMKDKTLHTAPGTLVLEGVTRTNIIECAKKNDYTVEEVAINQSEIAKYDSFFLSSTSTKIMPLCKIDDHIIPISDELRQLMKLFTAFNE